MALEKYLEFCDATSVIEDNNSVVLGDVRNFKTEKNTWGTTTYKELGGMTFVGAVTTTLEGAGAVDLVLTANTTNTLTSGTELARLHFPTTSVAGTMRRITLPPGTSAANYVGVVAITTGATTAGNVSAYLAPDKGQKVD